MTALEIAQSAAAIVGVEEPSHLKNNPDAHARAFWALLNRAGKTLAKMRNAWGGGWAILEKEHGFTTVAGQAAYPLPEDFGALLQRSLWDRGSAVELMGPLAPREWQALKSGLITASAPALLYRIRPDGSGAKRSFHLEPTPRAGHEIAFEYLSDRWVVSADGSARRAAFVEDSDAPLFDDDLVEMDLVWRFKQTRGLAFATELAEFEIERDRRLATDTGARDVRLARRPPDPFHVNVRLS